MDMMSAIGCGTNCIQFKLTHKPSVAGLNCGGGQYNKRNFTLLLMVDLIVYPGILSLGRCVSSTSH